MSLWQTLEKILSTQNFFLIVKITTGSGTRIRETGEPRDTIVVPAVILKRYRNIVITPNRNIFLTYKLVKNKRSEVYANFTTRHIEEITETPF